MTLPISGPFEDTVTTLAPPGISGVRPVTFERYRKWYRQKLPYDRPLDYTFRYRKMTGVHDRVVGCWPGETTLEGADIYDVPSFIDKDENLYNAVYSRFKNKLGDRAAIGISLVEGKQAMTMMENRLTQLAKFTWAVSRGKFGDAAKALGVREIPPGIKKKLKSRPNREVARDFSSNYLEFHFGWSPLVSDIYSAANVLSQKFPYHPISAQRTKTWSTQGGPVSYGDDLIYHVNRYRYKSYRQTIRIGAAMRVVNPNLALAEQLGLINPAVFAFEVAHLSFLLDWFMNVGDFLSSFTDFAGIELTNQYWTLFSQYTEDFYDYVIYNRTDDSIQKPPSCSFNNRYEVREKTDAVGIYVNRYVGAIPGPTLRIRDPWSLSPRRGLAAASLLMQRFPKQVLLDARPKLSRKKTPFRNGVLPPHFWAQT